MATDADHGVGCACTECQVRDLDIIDLAAWRREREEPPEPEEKQFVRVRGDKVEFWWPACGDIHWVATPRCARWLATELNRIAREVEQLQEPACDVCGDHGCWKFHPGDIREGWHRRVKLRAVVQAVLPSGRARMMDLGTGERFYVTASGSYWKRVGRAGPESVGG